MNNIKKTSIPVLIQILFCVILFIFPLYMMSRSGELDVEHYSVFVVRTTMLIILFYINYLLFIDKFFFNKKFALFIGFNILISIALLLLQTTIIELILIPGLPPELAEQRKPHPPSPYMRYWGDMLVFILVIGLSVALKVTLRWNQDSINIEKVKTAQLEADLRNLRNQLNPHFLFNTLNNIYSLITINTEKAQDSVLRLSSLLRYVLYENNSPFVPLSRDLEFTKDYINLMKLRMGANVRLDVSILGENSKDVIAPLMFMTLIENAFKHGVNDDENSYVDISILVESGKGLICSVKNSISSGDNLESRNSGIGLPNLYKRLELLYPKKHDLVINKDESEFSAQLRINLDQQEELQ